MAEANTYYTYPARALRVVDGDTVEMMVDQGFNDYRTVHVRLRDVDTDEIYGIPKESDEYQRGMEQKRFVEDFTEPGSHEFGDWPLSLRTFGKGKYGRWVGYVWKGETNLSEALIEEWPGVEDE